MGGPFDISYVKSNNRRRGSVSSAGRELPSARLDDNAVTVRYRFSAADMVLSRPEAFDPAGRGECTRC
jgi:hypothetical protein